MISSTALWTPPARPLLKRPSASPRLFWISSASGFHASTASTWAQLPGDLHHAVTEEEPSQQFPLEEFYNRVASRLNLNFHEAIVISREVMAVVVQAVTPGEINDILAKLPTEYAELFGRVPAGQSVVDVHTLTPGAV